MPAYRETLRRDLRLSLSIVASLALVVAAHLVLSRISGPSVWGVLVPLCFLAGLIAVIDARSTRSSARRTAQICAELDAQGFMAEVAPRPERAAAMFEPVRVLEHDLALSRGEDNVQWFALHRSGRCYFEHRYATGSGRSSTVHARTVLVFHRSAEAELPALRHGDGPGVVLHRGGRLLLQKFAYRRHADFTTTGLRAFDKDWVTLGDRDAALQFLSEPVRHQLQHAPVGESWVLRHGFVCCAYQGMLEPAAFAQMVAHTAAVLHAAG